MGFEVTILLALVVYIDIIQGISCKNSSIIFTLLIIGQVPVWMDMAHAPRIIWIFIISILGKYSTVRVVLEVFLKIFIEYLTKIFSTKIFIFHFLVTSICCLSTCMTLGMAMVSDDQLLSLRYVWQGSPIVPIFLVRGTVLQFTYWRTRTWKIRHLVQS